MLAVVYEKKYEMKVKEVERPWIQRATDAILRVTTSGICGSDLHMYEGRTALPGGTVVGHEIMGIIEEVGEGVEAIRRGDRVVLPFNISCGTCFNCTRGYTSACLTMNPDKPHAAYGYAGMGPFRGGQAEFVLAPHADFNCLKLPGHAGDEWEDDFLLLSDVFPTGFFATELAGVEAGSTVAVFGAGPVGLMAAYSAVLKSAAEVYVVDFVEERLEKALQFGATPVNINEGDPVEQIMALRRRGHGGPQAMLQGEEKMAGVMCGIDAVGFQARDDEDYAREEPMQVINNLARLVNPTGRLGLVGVYMAPDPEGRDDEAKEGRFPLPIAKLFEKGLSVGMGQTPVKRYSQRLRDMIIAGQAKPSGIVSRRIAIEEAPEAYRKFDRRAEGYTKVLIKMVA